MTDKNERENDKEVVRFLWIVAVSMITSLITTLLLTGSVAL